MGVAENICRACNRSFSNSGNRRRHELDTHHFKVDQGRTVSPTVVEVRSRSLPTPMDTDEDFATPGRRSGRSSRRSLFTSVSPIESPHVPVLSLTPSPTFDPGSTADIEMEDSTNEVVCSSCCRKFSSMYYYKKHKPCKLQSESAEFGDINPVVLRPPRNIPETMDILRQLSETDQIQLCQLQHWAVRDLYPITFPGSGAAGTEMFHAYTANTHSTRLLRQFLMVEKRIFLPRCIIIEDTENGVSSYISESYLRPLPEFYYTVTNSDFEVTLDATDSRGGGGGGGSDDGDSGGDDSDPGPGDDSDPGDDDSDDSSDDSSDYDSDGSGVISHRLQPAPVPSAFAAIRHLLPSTFQPGVDGQGIIP